MKILLKSPRNLSKKTSEFLIWTSLKDILKRIKKSRFFAGKSFEKSTIFGQQIIEKIFLKNQRNRSGTSCRVIEFLQANWWAREFFMERTSLKPRFFGKRLFENPTTSTSTSLKYSQKIMALAQNRAIEPESPYERVGRGIFGLIFLKSNLTLLTGR